MKTTFLLFLFIPFLGFSQKDYSEKQLLKNDRVLEFAKTFETKPENIISFLKCLKSESKTPTLKELPFFTGNYSLIVDKRIEEHNQELWEIIATECKQKTIFIAN